MSVKNCPSCGRWKNPSDAVCEQCRLYDELRALKDQEWKRKIAKCQISIKAQNMRFEDIASAKAKVKELLDCGLWHLDLTYGSGL